MDFFCWYNNTTHVKLLSIIIWLFFIKFKLFHLTLFVVVYGYFKLFLVIFCYFTLSYFWLF